MDNNKFSITWDEEKNSINIKKHGVDFKKAKQIFFNNNIISTQLNSIVDREERWQSIGNVQGKLIIVIYSLLKTNCEEIIRIISARKPTPIEEQQHCRYKKHSDEVLGHAAKSNVKAWFGANGYRKNFQSIDKKWR